MNSLEKFDQQTSQQNPNQFKIIIDHGGYEFRNVGDLGMLQAAIERIQRYLPNAKISVFTRDPVQLQKYCPGTVSVPIEGRELWLQQRNLFGAFYRICPQSFHQTLANVEKGLRLKRPVWAIKRITRRLATRGVDIEPMKYFLQAIQESDALVVAGGSFLTDSFPWQADRILETIQLATVFGKPVAMFGQGLGPLESPSLRRKVAQAMAHIAFLSLREERRSKQLLQELGIPTQHLTVTGDDTVEMAYLSTPDQLGNGLGINMRLARYSHINLKELGNIRKIIAEFSYQHKVPIYGVPISRHAGDSDVATTSMLLRNVPGVQHLGTTLTSPRDIIQQIGKCRLVVTGAYHGAVYALAQGISVIALVKSPYYQYKFEGLVDQYGPGCKILYMDTTNFEDQLKNAMAEQWDRAPTMRDQLLAIARIQAEKANAVYQQFFNLLQTKQIDKHS